MKKFVQWSFIIGAVVIALVLIARLVNPDFAARMDKAADSTHRADSVQAVAKAEMQKQLAAEAAAKAPKLLDVSLDTALEGFSEIEGVTITESPLANDTKRTMAQYQSFILECVGEKENLSSVSLMMLNDGNKQNAMLNTIAAQRLFKNVLKSEDLNTFAEAIQKKKSDFIVGGRTVKVVTGDIGDVKSITLTIEA